MKHNTEKISDCNQSKKIRKLCRMLSKCALSVALISWYSTANGLHQYVFDNIWQAYIISAALQGALFVLSIKGVTLFLDFKFFKKIMFFIVWGCLLCASSVFSYVYISKTVYSDKLLREDADRIFTTYCLSENYKLRRESDSLLNGSADAQGVIGEMGNYVEKLAMLNDGIELTEGDNKTKIKELRKTLLSYDYSYNKNEKKGMKKKKGYIDTSKLVSFLDTMLDGKYTEQEITNIKTESTKIIAKIKSKKKETITNRESRINDRKDYQNRLKTFRDTESAAYKDLIKSLNQVKKEIDNLDVIISNLDIEEADINGISVDLDSVQQGLSATLYNIVVEIRNDMNKDKIPIEKIQENAESIYQKLLENSANISADDERLTGYVQFKNNLIKYQAIIEAQETINTKIDSLYQSRSTDELLDESGFDKQKKEASSASGDDEAAKNPDKWVEYWQIYLNSLKECAKKLQISGLKEDNVTNLIDTIENNERLYLSDLNDFERAWGLLLGTNPKHRYRALLIFSLGFAFGIDLFAVFISVLIYLLSQSRCSNTMKEQSI